MWIKSPNYIFQWILLSINEIKESLILLGSASCSKHKDLLEIAGWVGPTKKGMGLGATTVA